MCAGCGGVGKTTLSAALGVRASQLGLQTLVLTVDPSRRLMTALGLDLNSDEIKTVANTNGLLSASVIDSEKIFERFILHHAPGDSGHKILRNPLYKQLSTTLSGSQEFTALYRLVECTSSGAYDLVILDTPPAQHAIDFLVAPERIYNLFQDSVTKWFLLAKDTDKAGFISGLIGRGTTKVIKALETLTGGQFIEELVDFFGAIRAVQSELRQSALNMQRLLSSSTTTFFLVTAFDEAKIIEAGQLRQRLASQGFDLSAVIINRAFPDGLMQDLEAEPSWAQSNVGTEPESDDTDDYTKVLKFYQKFREYHAKRYNFYEAFVRDLPKEILVLRLPEFDHDIFGPEDLKTIATRFGPIAHESQS